MRNPNSAAKAIPIMKAMINLGTADVFTEKDGWTVVTEDHKVSCHEEHTVAVFEDHTEILTDLNYSK